MSPGSMEREVKGRYCRECYMLHAEEIGREWKTDSSVIKIL